MTQITEDYVSFDIAKLLKEKGFKCDVLLLYYYDEDGDLLFSAWKTNDCKNEFDAPTLHMVMKWLRKNFNLNPVPYALSLGWAFDIFNLSDRDITGCKKLYSMDFPTKSACYETYEEAAEAAIKYCLENLI